MELSKFDVTNVYQSYGGFGFNLAGTSSASGDNVNAMANFQVGFLNSFNQGNYELVNDRNHFPGIYAQDSWKPIHGLTLNYGVRWEMFAPWANRVGDQTAFSPTNYAANKGTPQYSIATKAGTAGLPAGMVLSGDSGFPKNGVNNKYMQFMPRVGFAYDCSATARPSVRGGTGVFFQDRLPGFFNLNQASFVPNTDLHHPHQPAADSRQPRRAIQQPVLHRYARRGHTPTPSRSLCRLIPRRSSRTRSRSGSTIHPATFRCRSRTTTT